MQLSTDEKEPGKFRQFVATVTANLWTLTFGVAVGWASPVILDLEIGKTPVSSEPMSSEEISWLVGGFCAGAVVILPFCDRLAENLGRKRTGYIMAVPSILSWLLTAFATNYICLLIARIFVGIAGAMCLFLVPIYVAEISGDSIRGQLGSILRVAFNLGLVVGYILGAVLSYEFFAFSALALPILSLVGFWFLPETPVYLVRKGMIVEATRSLQWLKSNDRQAVDEDLDFLQHQAHHQKAASPKLKDLFRDRATFRGFIIALGLLNAPPTCGLFVVLTYTATIFKLAGSSLSPNASTIVVGVIQVFGAWLSTMTMEKTGRRNLIFLSSFGMIICHCILGGFFLLQSLGHDVSSFGWLPVLALSIYVIVYGFGVGPIPFIVATEIFSPEISGFANCICQISMWLVALPSMKYFPALVDLLGIHNCFFIFAGFCGCTIIFTHYLVPETRGKNIQTILDELNGPKWRET